MVETRRPLPVRIRHSWEHAGASTVILAMGHGRKAAAAIDVYLKNDAVQPEALATV